VNDPPPNYMPLIETLAASGAFPAGQLTVLEVAHDDTFDVWGGRACNCEPTVNPRPADHA
jgi:hypothetical protein